MPASTVTAEAQVLVALVSAKRRKRLRRIYIDSDAFVFNYDFYKANGAEHRGHRWHCSKSCCSDLLCRRLRPLSKFLAEVKRTAVLNHPRIVRLVGVSWDFLTDLCAVLEYAEGGDLIAFLISSQLKGIAKASTTKRRKLCFTTPPTCNSLEMPKIHRDLKFKNVLLNEKMEAKLTDFGGYREQITETMSAGVCNSLWMAPEVMMGDAKADIFSFGVVGGDAICDEGRLEGLRRLFVLETRKPSEEVTMRRPKRATSQPTTRVRWMAPISPGEASPMDKLMAWLERNGEVYRTSKRKLDMLGQLGEELETSGIYGLTVSSIRSQLTRLKHKVKVKAEGGTCTSTDANHYYDRLLATLFDEDERAAMRARAVERAAEEAEQNAPHRRPLLRTSRRTPSRPREATQEGLEATDESDAEEQRSEPRQDPGANSQPIPDTAEIRRRFELLSARQSLQRQGVDQETIDSMLPLRL